MLLRQSLVLCLAATGFAVCVAGSALAEPPTARQTPPAAGPAFEANLLWPVFPGGMSELKLLLPVLGSDRQGFSGDLIAGIHTDFAWRLVREADAGNVAFVGLKLGYRQFFAAGWHAELALNAGHRHQRNNPYDGETLHAFAGRLWGMAGYQWQASDTFYLNLRGGGGLHLFRTDRYSSKEKTFAPAGDVNLGFSF